MNNRYLPTYRISIRNYLSEIDQFHILTASEEKELGVKIQNGDERALEKLVQSNLRFVVSIAKEYQNRGLPLEDLINEGNIGLIRAARKYDPSKQAKFITYAVWWIRQKIMDSIIKHANSVRIPYNKAWEIIKVKKTRRSLEKEIGRDPSIDEVYKKLNIKKDNFAENLSNMGKDISLESLMFGEEGSELKTRIENSEAVSPDAAVLNDSLAQEMKKILDSLPTRQGTILKLYFGLDNEKPLNLTEIGGQLNLSRERIRQLKEVALERIRTTSKGKLLMQYLG